MLESRVRDLVRAIAFAAGIAVVAVFAACAYAEQPACVGDRHYDGVACCLESEACAPVLPCPDPAPCQPVRCQDGDDGATVVVDRCPEPEVLEVCKVRRDGTTVCPRRKRAPGPRRIYVPRSVVEKISDVERY